VEEGKSVFFVFVVGEEQLLSRGRVKHDRDYEPRIKIHFIHPGRLSAAVLGSLAGGAEGERGNRQPKSKDQRELVTTTFISNEPGFIPGFVICPLGPMARRRR
jgi:hypothetical protein